MNSVSGSYSYTRYQPSPATNLSSIEFVAFVLGRMMWIGANRPIELPPPVDFLAQINEGSSFPASPATRIEEAKTVTKCSGAQSKCGRRAIKGVFRRKLAETGGCV